LKKNIKILKTLYISSEIKLFSGGDTPRSSNPCQARTYHGYLGIEDKVVRFITSFINQDI